MAAKQSQQAKEFATYWQGKGDEKQETSRFWIQLLGEVLGAQDPSSFIEFEKKVKLAHTSYIDAYIPKTKVLIEQKSSDIDLHKEYQQSDGKLLTPFQQAKRYADEMPYSTKPRWIVVCNFQEFLVYDLERPHTDPEQIFLKDFEKEIYRLRFLIDENAQRLTREEEISLKAGDLVGKLYDALQKQYINPDDPKSLLSLNVLCVRIVFCLYAEDAGLFATRTSFEDYIRSFNLDDLRDGMIKLFKALNTQIKDRDKYDKKLIPFPYADGGLFMTEDIEIPNFTQEIVDVLVNYCAPFDWSEISPTIFGALFESTLNPETRAKNGMHYTSIANIHKLIDPLFMDELTEEYNDIVNERCSITAKKQKLFAFQHKLANLKFLDPACGSGNFLTETYLSLRRLENKVIAFINDGERAIGYNEFICVKISQFYGIEINDFAVTVAKTALWIAESQMTIETEKILGHNINFLPLKSNSNIIEGNALCINWKTLKPEADSLYTMPDTLFFGAMADNSPEKHYDYIIGNPPFVGARMMNTEQKSELVSIFGNIADVQDLDYVTCWYKKAAQLIKGTRTEAAFVSTNSICQGSQVPILWSVMIKQLGVKINFAYRTFKWISESTEMAAVHCVIVGFANFDKEEKLLFDSESKPQRVKNISPYLTDSQNVYVEARKDVLCPGIPKINMGNMARDGGHFFISSDEKDKIIKKYPSLKKWIHPVIGAEEFINNKKRYCFWLNGITPEEVKANKILHERVDAVKKFRISSNAKTTRGYAKNPYIWAQIVQPDTDFIVIPVVSSERRPYVPIGFLTPDHIPTTQVQIIPGANMFHFGVLTSSTHMAWMRYVCGRLEMRYRYSKEIVYNNFPWCQPSEKQMNNIIKTSKKILDVRKKYPESSFAALYDDVLMPPDLRKAHYDNDLAVIEAYGWNKDITEDEIVTHLFELYEKLTK